MARRRLPRPPDSPKSDPQRERVYQMEAHGMGGWGLAGMTLPEMRTWAKASSKLYGVPECRLSRTPLGKWAGHYWDGAITLASDDPSGRSLLTLAHEFSHHLHWQILEETPDIYHGPDFVTCYLHVLDATRLVPIQGMRPVCEAYKVKYLDLARWDCATTLAKRIRRAQP